MTNFSGTREEIVRRGIDTLSGTTSIRQTARGGKARALLEANASEVENLIRLRENDLRKPFLRTAQGQYLDHFGATTGISKFLRRNAEVLIEDEAIKFYPRYGGSFGTINGGSTFTIFAGTRIEAPEEVILEQRIDYADGAMDEASPQARGIIYALTQDVICEPSATYAYAAARAATPGRSANIASPGMLIRHNFEGYAGSRSRSLAVTNLKPILNGMDEENIDSYRYRISKAITDAERANLSAIMNAIRSVPGVADIAILPYEDGAGRFTVYIKSISSLVSDKTVRDAQRAMNAVVAAGNIGYVKKPFEIGVEISSTPLYRDAYSLSVRETIRRNLEIATMSYINSLDLGEGLSLPDLASAVRSADSRILSLGSNEITEFDSVFVYYPAKLAEGGKRREKLIAASLFAAAHSRILVEPSISNPINFS